MKPAFPVRERLKDKLLLVVSSKVGRVVLEPLYNEITFFRGEERRGTRVLERD
jgi:hypothetical protein